MSRKTSTVVFYQPDEEEVITRPGDRADTDDVERSNVSKLRIIGRKSTESEDSGVRSSSNEDDDGRRRSRFSLPRFSRISMSAPVFVFPSFDELFQSGGETKLTLHRSPTATSDVFPRSHTSPSLAHLQSRADTLVRILRLNKARGSSSFEHAQELSGDGSHGYGGEINSECSVNSRMYDVAGDGASASECALNSPSDEDMELDDNSRPSLSSQRQDSIMVTPFTTMVYKSFHESKGFAGFRMRLGNYVLHKYCMCCRSDSMPLVFAHVLLGMLIVSAGVLGLVHCFEEVMVNVYMCVDGIFCVFLFPILIMNWTKRVGSCVNENEKEKLGRGTFWICTVIFRFISVAAGTAVVLYRRYWQSQVWTGLFCEVENSILFYIVFIEWGTIVILLIIPILIYGGVYCVAPYCNSDTHIFY